MITLQPITIKFEHTEEFDIEAYLEWCECYGIEPSQKHYKKWAVDCLVDSLMDDIDTDEFQLIYDDPREIQYKGNLRGIEKETFSYASYVNDLTEEELQRKIDEEDNDKNFKNSLDIIKEWGEKNKPPTLKELLWEWWEDIFTVDADLDADASIDVLVDIIDKKFIPPSSEKNGYEWEKCLKIMREKLR